MISRRPVRPDVQLAGSDLTYTPGTSLWPQPTPQLTIPASCHTPPMSHTRGLPPSPGHRGNDEERGNTELPLQASLPSSPPAQMNPGWRRKLEPSLETKANMYHCTIKPEPENKAWTQVNTHTTLFVSSSLGKHSGQWLWHPPPEKMSYVLKINGEVSECSNKS